MALIRLVRAGSYPRLLRGAVETGEPQEVCRPAVILFGQVVGRHQIKYSLQRDISRVAASVRYQLSSSWGVAAKCTMPSNFPYWRSDSRSIWLLGRRLATSYCCVYLRQARARLGRRYESLWFLSGFLQEQQHVCGVFRSFLTVTSNTPVIPFPVRNSSAPLRRRNLHHEDQRDHRVQTNKFQRWIPESQRKSNEENVYNQGSLEMSCSLYPRVYVPFPIW